MSDIGTRWAVIVIARFLNEQHLERHREVYYVAKVVTNTQGELTREGRNYVFGRTIDEVEFYEGDLEKQCKEIANRFNSLWGKNRIKQELHVLARTLK